jgi:tetratricopeptide (TPR) repeat protein
MEVQQKWTQFLSELERSVSILNTIEDCKELLNRFEAIDEDYRDHEAPRSYMLMWKVAFRSGKLSLANTYAKKFLQYLIEYKRVPQIRFFINSLQEAGLFKKNLEEYLLIEEILLGKREKITQEELKHIEIFLIHPEHWKRSSEFLQQYLLLDEDWALEQWKLCYEFILKNHFDKEIFIYLIGKANELNKKDVEKKFNELFEKKKIKLRSPKTQTIKVHKPANDSLNLDYDQVAMDLLSGVKEPNNEEQGRVLSSLKFIPEDELKSRGQEMIIAFELLGMEKVVLSLCEKMISILIDAKERASTYYVWAQALSNIGDFYKAIDLIDDVIQKEPLVESERMAFLYIKAEACLKLKKIKMAKELYLEIKKQNPHYRLVGERLKTIEATK